MKLSMKVSVGLLVVGLAVPAVEASTVTRCPLGTYGVYYVLYNESVTNAAPIETHTYTLPVNPNPPPVNPTEPRRYDELLLNFNEPPPFYAMCSNDVPTFEAGKGIHTGDPVAKLKGHPSELHEVLDANNQSVGTVWRDQLEPFDQGGAIAGQLYWACGGALIPTVLNYSGFSSGLDVGAINDTREEDKELHYSHFIRERFEIVVRRGMETNEQCFLLTKAEFLGLPNQSQTQVWFRVYDPTTGAGDTQ